jgi:hypothetical protein
VQFILKAERDRKEINMIEIRKIRDSDRQECKNISAKMNPSLCLATDRNPSVVFN